MTKSNIRVRKQSWTKYLFTLTYISTRGTVQVSRQKLGVNRILQSSNPAVNVVLFLVVLVVELQKYSP